MGSFDAVIALTGEDDANILACLYSKSAGAKETIAVVHRLSLLPLLADAGIDVAITYHSDKDGAEETAEAVRGRGARAIVVGNDQMALGLMHACRDAGLTVPGDVSIVGFDDVPEAAHYPTALTTVRQEFEQVGATAMRILLDDLAGRAGLVHQRIPPELIVRASTAPSSS